MKHNIVFDFPKIPVNKPFKNRLMVTIEGENKENVKKLPLNLAVVLDRSGSMQGAKLHNVKEAVKNLLWRLEKKDIFSLTIFDNEVISLVKPTPVENNQREILARIDSIGSRGCTFLSGGYQQGFDYARRHQNAENITRIILLTDGLANEGITDTGQLSNMAFQFFEQGVTTTTIGVGYDFNEDLLVRMSESGGGANYFIENPAEAESVFQEELGDLRTLSGIDLTIQFTPKIPGLAFDQLNTYRTDSVGVYWIGDIYGSQQRNLVLELDIPPVGAMGSLAVGQVDVSIKETENGEFVERKSSILAQVEVVSEEECANQVSNRDVILQSALLTVSRVLSRSIRLADQRKFEEAADLLDQTADQLESLELDDDGLGQRLREMRERANNLRYGKEVYFSARIRKRYTVESDLALKSKSLKYEFMKHRQAVYCEPETDSGFDMIIPRGAIQYYCYELNGHILFETPKGRVLVDTGAVSSFGEFKFYRMGSKSFPLANQYLGCTINDISQLIGTKITTLLGMDVIGNYDLIIDLPNNKIGFFENAYPIQGKSVPMNKIMGIPFIDINAKNKTVQCAFDTGAKLNYISAEFTQDQLPKGTDTDFYPGFGEFSTDVYEIHTQIGDLTINLTYGVLPKMLQSILSMTGAQGIIGAELYLDRAVCISNHLNKIVFTR